MTLGTQVAAQLPYLRRYARALTGSQTTGDAFVRATLEAALSDSELHQSLSGGRVPLYRAFNKVWASACLDVAQPPAESGELEVAAQARLAAITPLNRQALQRDDREDIGQRVLDPVVEFARQRVADRGLLLKPGQRGEIFQRLMGNQPRNHQQ
jgi:DNA-directed RNA polymerase specialized sigma24 family protein